MKKKKKVWGLGLPREDELDGVASRHGEARGEPEEHVVRPGPALPHLIPTQHYNPNNSLYEDLYSCIALTKNVSCSALDLNCYSFMVVERRLIRRQLKLN